ncbi:selenite/tellurite reduction operon rhodanese-like protein ExtH [Geobacter grbiciae]|uniref:selenite/tellurite reduction operon rhodanese-like protein ExtH n=1 Tax=Geobacter grbiciae TaxID=155042 RepID=UPI001C02FE57|nr:selenite/tellurite reduction operon rhodanese-like protein ExtH [Geobacter grbiciae]MBT1075344.1 sulfurtransferase [Geobacter grbiciae]
MAKQAWRKGRIILSGMLGVVALAMLTLWGCGGGGSSYDTPSTNVVKTKTDNALINAAKLKEWADAGLVNKAGAYERVVIIEVTSDASQYAQGHIPGAVSVNLADLTATRLEGPGYFGAMVATGEQVDALIQKAGIDQYTTIVFTTSDKEMNANTLWNLTRGYTTFRYWGFPKERLKVLDGGNKAWMAAGYDWTPAAPSIPKTTYSVTPNGVNRVQADLRASLSEMIAAVTAGEKDFIDGRGSLAAGTTDLLDTSKYVVFEGRIKGTNSRFFPYTNLVDANKLFKSITDVQTLLNIKSDTAYTLCRAGNIASVLFFAIDGYAYYDGSKKAVWYDGSWGQWGLMSSNAAIGGMLRSTTSVWDTTALTSPYTQNFNNTVTITGGTKTLALTDIISYSGRLLPDEPPITANQLEDADKAYRSPSITAGSQGPTANAGGGC